MLFLYKSYKAIRPKRGRRRLEERSFKRGSNYRDLTEKIFSVFG